MAKNRHEELEQRIKHDEGVLTDIEQQRIFTSNPIERRRIEKRIEELQKTLFERRKQLAALSHESLSPADTESQDARPRVFISYNLADQDWFDRLRQHLTTIEDSAVIDIWHNRRIETEVLWRDQIEASLVAAKVAVLLVSADYLASDFVIERELPFLLQAASARGLPILSVILSPCRYERSALREFEAVNSPTSPLTAKSQQEQDHILAIVSESIRRIIQAPQAQVSEN